LGRCEERYQGEVGGTYFEPGQLRVIGPGDEELCEQHQEFTLDSTLDLRDGRSAKTPLREEDQFQTWVEQWTMPLILFTRDWAKRVPETPLP
jgi:hypothetical protein